jgi:4-amino-4-deoxy-L-arabinose transferase-like glycosyltransferase
LISLSLLVFTTGRAFIPNVNYWEQLATWLAGILCLLFAVRGTERLAFNLDLVLVGGLVAAALVVRVFNLNNIPYLLDQDEAKFVIQGLEMAQHGFAFSPFQIGFHSYPLLYQGLLGASQSIMGESFAAIRLVPTIFGAVSVGATYLLGKELFNRRVGMFAALFMLAWPFAFLFSRLALNQAPDPAFTTLAVFWLVRGWRSGSGRDFVLAGVMAAGAQLFYLGGRLIVPVLVAWLIWVALRDFAVIWRIWRGLALMTGAFLVTTLPQHAYLIANHGLVSTRIFVNVLSGSSDVAQTLETGSAVWDQVYRSFGGLFTVPDKLWYGDSSSLMLATGGVLLLIGVLIALWRLWRAPRYVLPLGWAFAVILIGTTLSSNPPQYQRVYPGVTALALLVGLGGVALADVIALALRRANERRDLAYGLAGVVCILNLIFLVFVYIPERHYLNNRPTRVTNQLGWQLRAALDSGRQTILVQNPFPDEKEASEGLRLSQWTLSDGVGDTEVIRILTWERPLVVLKERLTVNNAGVDYTQPFLIVAPLIDLETMDAIAQAHPEGMFLIINVEPDHTPAYVMLQSR